jgi:hypothetical protein
MKKRMKGSTNRKSRAVGNGSGLGLISIESIKARRVRWLWPDRIPSRQVTLIVGGDKVGKTLVVCKLAATISRGGAWPLGEGQAKTRNVIMISTEDDPATTLRPRLKAAGADLARIFVLPLGDLTFDLETGLERLAKDIRRIGGVRAIFLDPATALLGSIGRNNGDAIRVLFTRLAAFAAKHRLAVVLTAHLNKSNTVTGSFEWLAASRAAFLVAREPGTGRRLFVPRASTLAKEMPAVAFRIRVKTLSNGMVAPAVRWRRDPIEVSFDEALAATAEKKKARPAHSAAEQFVLDTLRRGLAKQKDIVALGRNKGFTPKMLRTARESLGVISQRVGGVGPKGWSEWSLPRELKQVRGRGQGGRRVGG